MATVVAEAAKWWTETYRPDLDDSGKGAERQRLGKDTIIGAAITRLQEIVSFLRYDDSVNWPLGTAQVIDVAKQIVVRSVRNDSSDLIPALDLALSDCLIPQTGGLLRTQLDAIEGRLTDPGDLQRSQRALERVRHSQQTSFG
jgi:hypothetical protein